ncbi:glycosyltransferase family 2 protein [Persicobacter psychrovividus]|uniref:Glycosyltransferase 2-like domain-containing protein n=1 Tax=Persicobacter psychrovividus TaxID=387638 RepID=A0ABM7VBJ3_9BACT|nr:hypothetical protein PEPS_03420 [Persicobacter psychrovividus]
MNNSTLTKGISVIIPFFNGVHLLKKNLPSIFSALQSTGLPHEVIVMDDCSTETPKEFLAENFPSVILIQNTVNLGFGANVNKGVNNAQYSLSLLLNSDIELTQNYFREQLPLFDKNDTFATGGKIVTPGTDHIEAGWKGYIRSKKIKWEPFQPQSGIHYSFYICGGNALVNTAKFIEIGGFSSLFKPFYVEDVELTIKAWRTGYKSYYIPEAVCHHETSSTIKKHFQSETINIAHKKNQHLLNMLHGDDAIFLKESFKMRANQLLSLLGLIKKDRQLVNEAILAMYAQAKAFRKEKTFNWSVKQVIEFTKSPYIS